MVAETWDGYLNDINGFHVKPEHAFHALESAHDGPVRATDNAGKPAKVALTAVMRKLILLANTLLKTNRPWT